MSVNNQHYYFEEIIPTNPDILRKYNYAKQCLSATKDAIEKNRDSKFVHIVLKDGGFLDIKPKNVRIRYNGFNVFIRADFGNTRFAFNINKVNFFGFCDGSNMEIEYVANGDTHDNVKVVKK